MPIKEASVDLWVARQLDNNRIKYCPQGSAGYAIYREGKFISTSDVMYGYADWS